MSFQTLLAQMDAVYWRMPPQASTVAAETDRVFYYIYWCSVFFFVLINGAMFYFMVRYRRRSPDDEVGHVTHSTPLEITWSIIPAILLVPMFWWGFKGFLDQRTVPPGAMDIRVDAKKWSWTFTYPDNQTHNELHVPVNKPIRLVMTSQDVIHSAFIAAFRVKRDIPPGRYSELWFTPTQVGEYRLTCAEYCGTQHSDMHAPVFVHPATPDPSASFPLNMTYPDWLPFADPINLLTPEQYAEYQSDPVAFAKKYADDPKLKPFLAMIKSPTEMGGELWKTRKGCIQCHTIDGTLVTSGGPSWKDVFGKDEALTDGTSVKVDENYLRESMLDPNKKIVKGFTAGVMPKIKLSDREIDALIAFIKSLSAAGAAQTQPATRSAGSAEKKPDAGDPGAKQK